MPENSNLPSDCLFLIGCDANGGRPFDALLGLRLAVLNMLRLCLNL